MIIIRRQIRGVNQKAVEKFLASVQRSIKLQGAISVLVTDNAEMKKLNRSFRNKDGATDVLSFAAGYSPVQRLAGDLAISADMAKENAGRLGHSLEEELKILVLHGVLHLAGYDHETDSGEMARHETHLRKKFHLPLSLIQRTHEPGSRVGRAKKSMVMTRSSKSVLKARHPQSRKKRGIRSQQ